MVDNMDAKLFTIPKPQSLKHSLCGISSKDVTLMATRRVWHGRPGRPGSHLLSTYISQARSCWGIRVFEPSVRPFVRPKVCQSNFLEPRLIFNRYNFVNLTWYLGHNM